MRDSDTNTLTRLTHSHWSELNFYLYGNDIGIEIGNELREVGPVVFDTKEEAISVPSYELGWLFLFLSFFNCFSVVLFRGEEAGLLRR